MYICSKWNLNHLFQITKSLKMRKINYVFYTAALILGTSIASCSSDNDITPITDANKNTEVTVSVNLPKSLETRATTEAVDEWSGRDKVESLTLYVANETDKSVHVERVASDKLNSQVITTNFKTTPGETYVYAVLNDTEGKITKSANKITSSTELIAFFKSEEAHKISAKAADLAKTTTEGKDIILMTNTQQPTKYLVAKKTAPETNKITVNVERVVSKAILSVKTGILNSEIEFKNTDDQLLSKIKITDISYGVGQSNNSVYKIKHESLKAPNYGLDGVAFPGIADNDGLVNRSKAVELASSDHSVLKSILPTETSSKYILPVLHDKYVKGNTTYFEVRVKFEVTAGLNTDDESGVTTRATEGETEEEGNNIIYFGASDHKFYTNRKVALGMGVPVEDADHKQKVHKFVNNEMVYILWVNPDKVPGSDPNIKTKESPTVRNQIYHAHINGLKDIGLPYNPLDPTDPGKPDPTDPTTPPTPIDPTDPLETENIYLDVEIGILPWGLHKYETQIGNDY